MARKVYCFESGAWVRMAVEHITTRLRTAIAARRRATLLLAGGSTPQPLYEALVRAERVDWQCVHFFWGDERHVPPDHADSNFGMVEQALLQPLGIARDDARVHRFPTLGNPRADAAIYEQNLRLFFESEPGGVPTFDVVLLGMGEDGHTASLFHGTEALEEGRSLAVANRVPELEATRLTVTLPLLNAARCVFVLVRGEAKAEVAREALLGEPKRYPIQQVAPANGEVIWLLDRPAAQHLPDGTCLPG